MINSEEQVQKGKLHFIGEITGCAGFDERCIRVSWQVNVPKEWKLGSPIGSDSGTTVADEPDDVFNCGERLQTFHESIDVFYTTDIINSWPKISFVVDRIDSNGRSSVIAYGFTNLPVNPGFHTISCRCWGITGGPAQDMISFFNQGGLVLNTHRHTLLHDIAGRSLEPGKPAVFDRDLRANGGAIRTMGRGEIILCLNVLLKNFDSVKFHEMPLRLKLFAREKLLENNKIQERLFDGETVEARLKRIRKEKGSSLDRDRRKWFDDERSKFRSLKDH